MKLIKSIYIACMSLALVMFNPGCSDILVEEPKSILTPEFFNTAQGIEGGVNAAYSYLRYVYGPQGPVFLVNYGTDEYTYGGGGSATQELNVYTGLDGGHGDLAGPWNRSYPAINTCNGVIELGPEADMPDELKANLIGEAKFLRAQWYFLLAQIYGGASLDLGSGNLAFNREPNNVFSRNTFIETMDAVIQDLEEAVLELPDAPREEGRVWKASAYHLLAKAYLTKAWSTGVAADFQDALTAVEALIPDPDAATGAYGTALESDFADVFVPGNEYESEILLSVNRNENIDFNEYTSGDKENRVNFFFRSIYYNAVGLVRTPEYGRPWWRFQPTDWLMQTAFSQKNIDSRYVKSFETVWLANDVTTDGEIPPNWDATDVANGYTNQDGSPAVAGEPKFGLGDTCLYMIPEYTAGLPADFEASKGYMVMTYDDISVLSQRTMWPGMSKHNMPLRPIAGTEDDANISSVRPLIVYRLAETYLLGAEAALMTGQPALAARYINTVRRRAAYAGSETAMEITGADVDIDYILDERSRELTGELMRFYDLARTNKLAERAEAFNPDIPAGRIQDYHEVRPIPQSAIDLTIDPTTADGKYPQNPGYN